GVSVFGCAIDADDQMVAANLEQATTPSLVEEGAVGGDRGTKPTPATVAENVEDPAIHERLTEPVQEDLAGPESRGLIESSVEQVVGQIGIGIPSARAWAHRAQQIAAHRRFEIDLERTGHLVRFTTHVGLHQAKPVDKTKRHGGLDTTSYIATRT